MSASKSGEKLPRCYVNALGDYCFPPTF